ICSRDWSSDVCSSDLAIGGLLKDLPDRGSVDVNADVVGDFHLDNSALERRDGSVDSTLSDDAITGFQIVHHTAMLPRLFLLRAEDRKGVGLVEGSRVG